MNFCIFGLLAIAAFAAAASQSVAATPALRTLISFCSLANCADGAFPAAGLIADGDGNLFGTALFGGRYGYGTVFEVPKTAAGYANTPTTLVSFTNPPFGTPNTFGSSPRAGVIADANGNLFGTTYSGGAYGMGTVFEITRTADGYASTPTILVSFNGSNGASPAGELIADAIGNLFGTTYSGGAYGMGTVFEITRTADGYASTPTILVSFSGSNGASPTDVLLADANGNLFGTTMYGGAYGKGTVFEITGSGFVVPGTFAGMPGRANCHGQSVSALARQFKGLNAAAAALGFVSVGTLQDAILAFCGG
jgi:uncharacterized repeat protein (TIGR03803 family)